MDYDLARLGSREFEHLVQALAVRCLGTTVEIFGDGPDGGREATFAGSVTWGTDQPVERWDGYAVVQAKFRQRPEAAPPPADWFIGQITGEMKRWADPESRRRKVGRCPEYMLWVTNGVLSAASGGGIDRAAAVIAASAPDLGLRGWRIWHYDTLCRLLDTAADVRTAFSGLITPGDVLNQLHAILIGQPADLGAELSSHAAKDLLAEQWVRLGEASPDNEKFTLDQVAVDLPSYEPGEGHLPTVARLVGLGDTVLRPSVSDRNRAPHRVIVGGPGQGKTTLSQLLAQTYRVALLEHDQGIGHEAAAAVASTSAALAALGIPRPQNKRWPIRIDLAEYGDAVAGGTELSIIRWIANKVATRGHAEVTPNRLHAWLGAWPWMLVLDGLDEVAALSTRELVLRRVSDLLVDAARADADLMIVATTRPQGYENDFEPLGFTHLHLAQLAPDRALGYARRLSDVRHRGDPDGHRTTLERVAEAAADPLTARLMRTPLQVTIMSILLERRPRPPRDRHGLFEAYYDTIYAREANKPGALAKLLGDHKADVNALHDQVGFRLQILAETAGDAEAALPRDDLLTLALDRLSAEGHDPDTAAKLADNLIRAATQRLVLLVPKGRDETGFEVRSLQEFMAARAIVTGVDAVVLDRLLLAARSAHWRNTWLLAAGRIFATREHMRDQVVTLLRRVDTDDLGAVIPAGPDLALDLLDDDLAARSPEFRRLLLMHALEVLSHPLGTSVTTLVTRLNDLAQDASARALISRALERGVHGAPEQRETTLAVLAPLSRHTGALPAKARQLLAQTQPKRDTENEVPATGWKGRGLHTYLAPHLSEVELSTSAQVAVDRLQTELAGVGVVTVAPDHHAHAVEDKSRTLANTALAAALELLRDPEATTAMALAVSEIDAEDWRAAAAVTDLLRRAGQRMEIGTGLLETAHHQRSPARPGSV